MLAAACSGGLPAVQVLLGHASAAAAAAIAARTAGAASSSGSSGGAAPAPARRMSTFALANTPLRSGPGGRSSVSGATATVFGATGFVGKYVVNELARNGTQVVCPHRDVEEAAMPLRQMGDLGQIVVLKGWSLGDDDMTRYALSRSNIVVNLIGATYETRNYSFEDVHTTWPAHLARLAKENPLLERFVHVSDVGADPEHPSARMRSKAAGDAAVLAELPGLATVLRPAPVVGDEDDFLNNILAQVKLNALFPLIDGGCQRVQPHHVRDLAEAVTAALATHDSLGKTYYLGGPEVVTLRDLVDLVRSTLNEDEDNTLYVPAALAKAIARPLDALKKRFPPLPTRNYMSTADWVDEISTGKVVPDGVHTYADLDMIPQRITEGMAMEPIRYSRTGGYAHGDTRKLAQKLPHSVKRYYGMAHEFDK
ncbi:NADH dehydrogenase mitochondrial [Raphidocelis subcapitata]|uniref:NADH dehydrogenase mitochondrial n=1 Tax=Raphidocelis subcapitata TaxID=307507 RepID=A0A2V0PEA3_9CHLO|nr:NADH dehydrogenase mitochondrial [Raphidocelis subcapitata]|eukprot:GBF98166.1 NADH dehydrogenase mitochondrial [Raphidocelis subcapitata]